MTRHPTDGILLGGDESTRDYSKNRGREERSLEEPSEHLGIPAETQLGDNIVFIRNADKPGVIGSLGTTLGESDINIGSFVLGRSPSHAHAVGVINTDTPVPDDVLGKIAQIPAVQFARVISLGN